jgi:exopolysaccharide biosynthesis polyprenyl glycosylphosphotransferase
VYTVEVSGTVNVSRFFAMRIKLAHLVCFLALLLVWHIVFAAAGLYDSRRMTGYCADSIDACRATSLVSLILTLVAFSLHIRMITPFFLLAFWGILSTAAVSSRLGLRYLLQRIRIAGRNLRNVLIVGTNPRAIQFAKKIESKPELGYRIIGFVDQTWGGLEHFSSSGYSIISDFDNLPTFLRETVVDEIVIALPMGSLHTRAARIVALCEEQGITSRVLSNIFDLKLARVRTDEVEGASIITNYTGFVDGWAVFAKRSLDVVFSAILLVAFAPLMLVVSALIKFSSPGPVLFTQDRLGLSKRQFRIYKFRTMIADAEETIKELEYLNEVSGPVFKIKNDPRITTIGKFLRKTSIDELPQLFNVLKGDMSLVGPRPLPVRDYRGFNQDWQRRRFSVRPGITCLWQINGRSSIPFEKWMQLDLQYIDKWSIWLDLQILVKTIPAVLKGYGAA